MPGTYHLTIATGAAVSSQAVIDRDGRSLAVWAASVAAQALSFQFAAQSGGPFLPLCEPGIGGALIVVSGTSGVSLPIDPPTPWFRLATAATLAATTSYMVVCLNRP